LNPSQVVGVMPTPSVLSAKTESGFKKTPVPQGKVEIVAYTEYASDTRVRREAEALVSQGFQVEVICARSESSARSSFPGSLRVIEVPLQIRKGGKARYLYQYTTFFLMAAALLVRSAARRRINVVHVHSLPDFQVFCALPLKIRRVPVILDLHEAMPEILRARFHVSQHSLWFRVAVLLERISCRFADRVIAANDGIRAAVVDRGGPANPITVVYNAGDLPLVGASNEDLRRQYGLPRNPLIVHAGAIDAERDLTTLVRAIALLPEDSQVYLVMVGPAVPEYLTSVRQEAIALGISERVLYLGKVAAEEAVALMSLSSVGVVTLEANPLTELAWPGRVVEFAHLEKPLIVPRLRFLQAQLADCALFYTPGDPRSLAQQLLRLMETPNSATQAIANAKALCRRFDYNHMKTTLGELYSALTPVPAS